MRIFLFFLTSCFCVGQSVTLGVLGGGRPTGEVLSGVSSESKGYVVGPTLEVGLPLGFSIEADGLYHRLGYQYTFSSSSGTLSVTETGSERDNTWEIPILLKYKIPMGRIKPFVMAGGSRRSLSGSATFTSTSTSPVLNGSSTTGGAGRTNYSAEVGVVGGAGVQFKIGRLQLSPQARFTHWGSRPGGYFYARQQVDLLVGIGWKLH
jgi:hypothetical protein